MSLYALRPVGRRVRVSLIRMQYFLGIETTVEINLAVCDVNAKDGINNVDAMLIMQKFLGIIELFDVEK